MVAVLKKGSDKKTIQAVIKKILSRPARRGIDAAKYNGSVKFKEDGLTYQKRMRDEW